MTDLRQLLARNMKKYRKNLGLTQEKLAEKLDTSSNYIANIETGKKFPSTGMLERIAYALELDTLELFSMKPIQSALISGFRSKILADFDQLLEKRFEEMEKNIKLETIGGANFGQQLPACAAPRDL